MRGEPFHGKSSAVSRTSNEAPDFWESADPYNTLVFPKAVWREVRADVTQEETAWLP
jgi:hypothetical protein